MLENIRIVMVNTTHAGNIGAAARAMKTMGLSQLWLVDPCGFPSAEATARASGAADVLEQAQVVSRMEEAIADCALVLATSGRSRSIPWPVMEARQCGEQACQAAAHGKQVAILFGREASGLTNEELQLSHAHVVIPTDSEYGVLNVAAATQVICYECRQAWLAGEGNNRENPGKDGSQHHLSLPPVAWDRPLATSADLEGFYQHLEKTLVDLDFLNPEQPGNLMTRLRRLFGRAQLDEVEINILRGILTAIRKSAERG